MTARFAIQSSLGGGPQLRFPLEGVLGQNLAVPAALAEAALAGIPGGMQLASIVPIGLQLVLGLGEPWGHFWTAKLRKRRGPLAAIGGRDGILSASPAPSPWIIPAADWSSDVQRAPGNAGRLGAVQLRVTLWCAKYLIDCTCPCTCSLHASPSTQPAA